MSYKVKLDIFEGPLDLLLYLIKKSEVDIYDIPISKITEQYLEYMEFMRILNLDIAGEFLVMAATLMHIKSRMLLPPDERAIEEEEEEDPREELVRRLLEYQKFKEAADELRGLEARRQDTFVRKLKPQVEGAGRPLGEPFFEASLFDLLSAFSKALKDMPKEIFQEIIKDEFTIEGKMHDLYHTLARESTLFLSKLIGNAKSKIEIIATFLAILELIRLKEILVFQDEAFSDIKMIRNTEHIKPAVVAE